MSLKSRLPFEVKEISEQGTFEGLLSPYGNVDAGGDIIEPGAFTKTLQDRGNTRPLMWEHREPIGELALDDRSDGLWVRGTLLMDLPEAKKAYLLLKARIAKGLSIGFKAIKAPIEGGIRHLKEIKLFEGSIVMFPMNELAQVISVKAAGAAGEDKADFNTELARLQTLEAFVQMPSALWAALRSVVWADLSREEKIAATATVLEQFTEGFTAFFPVYLDALEESHGPMETWSRELLETKAGAKFSAATQKSMIAACEKIQAGHDDMLALISKEAETGGDADSTSKGEAANPDGPQGRPGEHKSEPDPNGDHSAASTLLEEIRELVPR